MVTCRILLSCLLGMSFAVHAQLPILGKVTAAHTQEPLPFVYIVVGQKVFQTNDQGVFRIQADSLGQQLTFSYLGYQKRTTPATKTMNIELYPDALSLGELVVRYRNPAEEIIKKAVARRSFNNPDNYPSYSLKNYTKSLLTADPMSLSQLGRKRKKDLKMAQRLANSEWYVNETVVRKQYLFKGQHKEVIEASRTSGSANSTLIGSLALLLQPPHFYADLLTFRGRRIQEIMEFVNPISPNSHKLYDFVMLDTLISGAYSSYVIDFQPKLGSNFRGLKGEIIISNDQYAIEEITAEPAADNLLMSVKIHQTYHKIADRWFPELLSSEWTMPEFKVGNLGLLFKIESHLTEVSFQNPHLRSSDFTENTVQIATNATTQSDTYWQIQRTDSLSTREKRTFEYYEQLLGLRKFLTTASLNVAEWATAGVIPLHKYVDLSAQNLFDSNLFEGFRPTLNLLTSPQFSKRVRLDAKIAYGFGDQRWKYEARSKFNLDAKNNVQLTVQYRNDISEPANVQYFIWNYPQIPYELIRTFVISRADHLEQFKIELNAKVSKFGRFTIGLIDEIRTPTYCYTFRYNDQPLMAHDKNLSLHASIVSLGYRLAIGEKFSQVGRGSIITDVPKLVLLLNYEQGLMGFLSGQYQFSKFNAKFEYTHKNTRFGDTFFNLTTGKVFGSVPYTYLYNGRGAKLNNAFPVVWTANHFNTMGLYEFTSDQYANVFVTHNLKELLWKPRVSWSKPNVSVIQAMAIGSLQNPSQHEGIDIKTLEKGYFESGLTIDNILRFKLKKAAYLGLGGGVFYRWGAYQLPTSRDNFAYRAVWNIGF